MTVSVGEFKSSDQLQNIVGASAALRRSLGCVRAAGVRATASEKVPKGPDEMEASEWDWDQQIKHNWYLLAA